jgi:hypothetical protein
MNNLMLSNKSSLQLPFKSVAGALCFSVFLGPVGLLYASTLGGIMMILLAFVSISGKLFVTLSIVWLVCCVWSVIAVNRYNRNILKNWR